MVWVKQRDLIRRQQKHVLLKKERTSQKQMILTAWDMLFSADCLLGASVAVSKNHNTLLKPFQRSSHDKGLFLQLSNISKWFQPCIPFWQACQSKGVTRSQEVSLLASKCFLSVACSEIWVLPHLQYSRKATTERMNPPRLSVQQAASLIWILQASFFLGATRIR